MPAPNFANLNANPAGLLAWLDNNLLLAGLIRNVFRPTGLAFVSILPLYPATSGMRQPVAVNASRGQPMDVFYLRTHEVGALNSVRAYICDYTPMAFHSVTLGLAGGFCFTTNLNGCTYGIGPVQPEFTRLVTHSNRGGNTMLQRADIQVANGVGANLAGVTLLEPAEYRRLGGGGET